ncbi:hypothetical protein [Lacisediminimonas sp.]|uniref:hypothetical protein n=1 Tax=Lacisediminimonas sp. TaxID=3060582 RepID=UPI00272A167A|nr:hypothetical protein [Lacisediminimonas sp.]
MTGMNAPASAAHNNNLVDIIILVLIQFRKRRCYHARIDNSPDEQSGFISRIFLNSRNEKGAEGRSP